MAKSETVQSIIQSIREHREKFERFCRSLSEEELGRPVPESSWIVKDFVSHLATLDPEMARSFQGAAARRPEEASRHADGSPFDTLTPSTKRGWLSGDSGRWTASWRRPRGTGRR